MQLLRSRAAGTWIVLASLSSFIAPAAAAEQAGPLELRLAAGTFRPLEGEPAAPPWFREIPVQHGAAGRRHLVAITGSALTPEQRHDLERAGAKLLGYLPVHGYRLHVAPHDESAVRALPFVTWLGELPSHLKVSALVHERAGRLDGSPTAVRIALAPGEPETRVLRALSDLAVSAAPAGPGGAWRVDAVVPSARLHGVLSRLASFPEVESIEEARPVRILNQDGVWVHQSFVGPSPQQTPIFDRGIFGCGQVLSVADTGQDFDVCFFRDTLDPPISTCSTPPCPAAAPDLGKRKDVRYYNWSGGTLGDDDTCPSTLFTGSGHGTHTSGSAVGDTAPYADCSAYTTPSRNGGDGQAPGAKLVMIELGDDIAYLNTMGGTIWNIADVAFQTGSRIHSFSLGGVCYDALLNCVPGCTLPYDSLARDADLAMWTYPDLLLVNGAGNGGDICPQPRSIVTPALAKNLVTVGSVGHGTAANSVPSSSSPGPVFDGRLKPTLAAQGESVASAGSDGNPNTDNCGICSLSGTSMSAPTVAGLAALAREYYTAGFYATGSRNAPQGFTPTGALIKATLIDGAVTPGTGVPAAPDFDSGYGRVKLDSTLAFTGSPFQLRAVDDRTGLATGGVVTRAYDVAAGQPFRATLVWTDYPADVNAAVARVNELKLEVIDPSGNTWFQTLDGNGLPAQTTNGANPHDPVNVEERLVFNSPAAGRWVVRVVGVDVPWAPQPFALVVRGALTDCPAPAAPATPTLSTPADHQVQVSWASVPGAAAYNVYRSFGACPGGAWIPVATGVTGTSFLDTTVSGGAQYSYRVVAASDLDAYCESPPSGCASVVPTGDCFLAPDFDGVATATSDGLATCSVTLGWSAAAPLCSGPARYNVYRATTPGFTPSGANRIASCVTDTSYSDAADLVHGTDYYYVVRAEDGTTGHGGPCGGGNEEQNVAEVGTSPDGPSGFGTWTDDAGDSPPASFVPQSSWSVTTTGGVGGSKGYTGTSSALLCSDLVSPGLTLAGPAEAPQLSFKTRYSFDYDDGTVFAQQGSLAQVEIAIGPNFTTWDRVNLTGGYPTPIDFMLNDCPTTQVARNYFANVVGSYTTFTAPLSLWAGNDVKLRFHISGDLWWPGGQMWVDDVQVTQTLVPGSCATGSGGPPPIPDGASVPGAPMRAARNGANVDLTWDTSSCPAIEVNVYHGSLGNFSTFTGGHCGLAGTGAATVSMPANAWFLVVGTDGGSTDGSFSRDASGAELSYTGSTSACPAITQHIVGSCP